MPDAACIQPCGGGADQAMELAVGQYMFLPAFFDDPCGNGVRGAVNAGKQAVNRRLVAGASCGGDIRARSDRTHRAYAFVNSGSLRRDARVNQSRNSP